MPSTKRARVGTAAAARVGAAPFNRERGDITIKKAYCDEPGQFRFSVIVAVFMIFLLSVFSIY